MRAKQTKEKQLPKVGIKSRNLLEGKDWLQMQCIQGRRGSSKSSNKLEKLGPLRFCGDSPQCLPAALRVIALYSAKHMEGADLGWVPDIQKLN